MMNKMYRILILNLATFFLFFMTTLKAQTEGDIIWEDHFDDAQQDYLLNNVGWLYFTEDDGLVGQETYQTESGTAFIKSGVFNSFIGAGLIETNGISYIDPTNIDDAEKRMKEQSKIIPPNHIITFQVNFKKISLAEGGQYPMGTFFLCGTRMFIPDTSDAYPDPTVDSTYALYISPLTSTTMIAKFAGDLVVLNPAAWTVLGMTTDFEYYLEFPTWVKFYLYGADLKVKVWFGELGDEPAEWLLEVTDPDPWVQGTHVEFGLLGDPLEDGDEMELDDIVFRGFAGTAIEQPEELAPVKFELANNYPNPFNPATTIEFSLDKSSNVNLNIYTITGQLVRTLLNEQMAVGAHKVLFNGMDNAGRPLSSGIYFYQLQTETNSVTKKMVMMK